MIDAVAVPDGSAVWMIVPIIVPLAGGLLCFLAGRRLARWLSAATAVGVCASALGLALAVVTRGPRRYAVGGWSAPLGIDLFADGLTVAVLLMSAVVGTGVTFYAHEYFRGAPSSARRFWPLWLFLWSALHALFLSGDVFNLYVTLELLTFAAVPLITLGGGPAALSAAMRYLLAALLGSLAYLLGVAFLYASFVTLDIATLGVRVTATPAAWAAMSLMTVGLLLKTALFPLHFWLPPAHANAPAPVSALLSALVVKASFYLLLRLWFDVFPGLRPAAAAQVLGLLGAAAVVWGSLQALRQERLKMLIAYSTVAQLGYLFLLFPLATPGAAWASAAWTGGVYHAVSHACAKAAMFLAAGAIVQACGTDRLDSLAGRAEQLPVPLFAFGLAAVNSIGLPPSGGFVAKWQLLTAAFASGQWWWGLVLVGGSLLSAGYLFRVLRCAFSPAGDTVRVTTVPVRLGTVPLVLSLAAIALGLLAAAPLSFLQAHAPAVLRAGGGVN